MLRANGLEAKSKLGQNFLIDLNLMDIVVRSADLTRDDAVLEVGTGTGGLTGRLVELAGAVVSAEIDPGLHALARRTVPGQETVSGFSWRISCGPRMNSTRRSSRLGWRPPGLPVPRA